VKSDTQENKKKHFIFL